MSGLSLWLSPAPTSPLAPFLARLSSTLQTVAFAPHATLVSDEIVPPLELKDLKSRLEEGVASWRASQAVGEQQPTEIALSFKDVRQGDRFYQCVLAALVPAPSLFALHEALLTAFSLPIPSPPTYFPHLSLIYADLTSEQKAQIIADLKLAGDVVDLEGAGEGEAGVKIVGEEGFVSTEVLLVRTRGKPEEWEVLARVPLGAAPILA
ncbi:2',3'-cyclic-nucleotide 3'-phosphodiesterase [Leucosporidium creatinivorum]|uniref:2',3'-cyclic-nucleotide 3'-phosphodiesterase n=1 Tax=Leucosporidium creatinivorum TaxID=106004 RepID=A0A1Y2G3W0_9BASI|nr:2',3'-cyclic-nucleotide 3'-phosphodiesterase [Leucosporidium creatinivorum]